jgi:geranylgeranyl reductase family protein
VYDAIIVGAGPIGSHTAMLLAQGGLSVLMLEEHASIGSPVHCTGVVGADLFRRFALPRDCIQNELSSATFHSPGGRTISVRREEPVAYVIDRRRFDRRLAGGAVECGASVLLDVAVEGIESDGGGVRVQATVRGEPYRAAGRVCVLAGGSRCRLGSNLGISYPREYLAAAQTEAPACGLSEVEVYFGTEVAPKSFAWAVPVNDHVARIGVSTPRGALFYLRRLLEHPGLRDRVDARQTCVVPGAIPIGPPGRTFGERVIAVGDAAGQVKRTTGGGLAFGLLCSRIAAEELLVALRGDRLRARDLVRYERRWRHALGNELRMGLRLRRLVERFSDRHLDALFELLQRRRLAATLAEVVSFDGHSNTLWSLLRGPMLRSLVEGLVAPLG